MRDCCTTRGGFEFVCAPGAICRRTWQACDGDGVLRSKGDTDAQWEEFWSRFRRHESKLDVALLGAWLQDLLDLREPMSGRIFTSVGLVQPMSTWIRLTVRS